ncbi:MULTISPECIES: DUF4235 domain-containing protein [Protofrankia]|uniref:DUF4235 domain-containing protein n=1 Tax=Candidatus Protofrankia datiscae TaxID=2716812 RepID=F8B6F7_9ACTN|nr:MULTISPECIES: DUF4235 domain-containing protein [Protofrankia]AEH09253.1 hypothetical protein FsymDg_1806 [Candidatus Protofrankia datiscae]ONH36896.1 hypothetical protein BL254_05595 [Protofrankia sp. BMG5.30]
MSQSVAKIGWKIVGGVAGAVAGSVASKAVTLAYKKIRKSDPPLSPVHPDTAWVDAISWAAASGVAVGIGKLTAERLAARRWLEATGSLPPGIRELE